MKKTKKVIMGMNDYSVQLEGGVLFVITWQTLERVVELSPVKVYSRVV